MGGGVLVALRLGKGGIYRQERNDFYEATTLVRPVGEFPSYQPTVNLFIPRIPYAKLEEIVDQMRYVAVHRHAELMIAMYYSHNEQQYLFVIPEQTPAAFGSRLRTGPLPPSPPGYNMIGDIHSHMDFPAGHSPTDDADEEDIGGIHITIGDLVTRPFPTISCSVVMEGHRVFFDPRDLFEGPPVKTGTDLEQLTKLKIRNRSRVIEFIRDVLAVFWPERRAG
jgi:hypothetical protein